MMVEKRIWKSNYLRPTLWTSLWCSFNDLRFLKVVTQLTQVGAKNFIWKQDKFYLHVRCLNSHVKNIVLAYIVKVKGTSILQREADEIFSHRKTTLSQQRER